MESFLELLASSQKFVCLQVSANDIVPAYQANEFRNSGSCQLYPHGLLNTMQVYL